MKRVRLGKLLLGRRARVVGSIVSMADLRLVAQTRRPPFDVAEVRLDLIGPEHSEWRGLCRNIEKSGIPVLLTIRSVKEGGGWKGGENERAAIYRAALPDVSAIDVEIHSPIIGKLAEEVSNVRKTLIGSFHDFKRVPSLGTLRKVVSAGRKAGADIVKVAAMVKKRDDEGPLFELLREASWTPLCVIGMAKRDPSLRIRLPLAGSCLAYGSVGAAAAPGQIPCARLRRLLRDG